MRDHRFRPLRSMLPLQLAAAGALLAACGQSALVADDLGVSAPAADLASAPDLTPLPPSVCALLGLPVRAFDKTGPYGVLRDNLADDFTLTDQNGDFTLSKAWTGCETYVFVPDNIPVSPLDKTSIWAQDLDALLGKANDGAQNVHFFFISTHVDPTSSTALLSAQLDGALAQFPDGDMPGSKGWWRARVHIVQTPIGKIAGWVTKALRGQQIAYYGFGIDRFQRLKGLGNFADEERFDSDLNAQKQWPWQNNLAYAAHPAIYFNYEAARQAAFDAEKNVTLIKVFDAETIGGGHEKDVLFPDAATMAGFDTFEVDLTMDCPDGTQPEEANNNCGAWDYLAGLSFQRNFNAPLPDGGYPDGGAPAPDWGEAARFITTYHRAGRFTLSANHFLPYLAAGGMQHISLNVANTYKTTLVFRLYNAAKGGHPTRATWLFGGGDFNLNYNPSHMTPVSVPIPPTAKRVELHAIITGHGNPGCAEFCDHQHIFTVNGHAHTKDFPEASNGTQGDPLGCLKKANHGAIPNQSGTWWFGRGGWCPGMQVDPWVVDVTADVQPGTPATVSYKGLLMNQQPNKGGNIVMNSWLVVWE